MSSAIFAGWISVALLASVATAQEKPWEMTAFVASYGVHYTEDITRQADQPGDLTGNSFTAAALQAVVTYHGRRDLNLPFSLGLRGSLPIANLKGLEVGHLTKSGQQFKTQQEDVSHSASWVSAQLAFEMLPELQPYAQIEFSKLSSRRLNQVNGNDQGTFDPVNNQDYTETVTSTQLGFGLLGAIALDESDAYRIRYEFGYEVPQHVTVADTYFDPGEWGQGTTGYTLNGRIALDLPFAMLAVQRDYNGYLTIGALVSKRHWDGNGRVATELFASPRWPANDVTIGGGFIGTGIFF